MCTRKVLMVCMGGSCRPRLAPQPSLTASGRALLLVRGPYPAQSLAANSDETVAIGSSCRILQLSSALRARPNRAPLRQQRGCSDNSCGSAANVCQLAPIARIGWSAALDQLLPSALWSCTYASTRLCLSASAPLPRRICPSADLNAQSFCGYFYWTGSYGTCKTRYLTTSWTGACNDGYYRRAGTANTGTCTGGKTCCYDPGQGYAGSCTHVCTYNLCPNCCYYCCKCTNVSALPYHAAAACLLAASAALAAAPDRPRLPSAALPTHHLALPSPLCTVELLLHAQLARTGVRRLLPAGRCQCRQPHLRCGHQDVHLGVRGGLLRRPHPALLQQRGRQLERLPHRLQRLPCPRRPCQWRCDQAAGGHVGICLQPGLLLAHQRHG